MDGLKRVGSEFLRPSNSCHGVAFPSLEVLRFSDMKEWEEWSTSGCDKVGAFPCVREISITICPKLKDVNMVISMNSHTRADIIEKVEAFPFVREISISNCPKLNSVAIELIQTFSMESLTYVKLEDCQSLESYKCPNSIESLTIERCQSVTSLTFQTVDDLPSSTLKNLTISDCDNMEVSWPLNNFLSSLEKLYLDGIPNLRLFPEGCLVNLTTLIVKNCDNIESIPENGYGFLPYLCLRKLKIINCKNLKSFPHEHLQSLASLIDMEIVHCSSMDHSFPCGLWITRFPTSLTELWLYGENSGVVSFGKMEEDIMSSSSSSSSLRLPSSLTSLYIEDFMELESVSVGLQHLTCLTELTIYECPKLRDLPETLLPSLETLAVFGSACHPELEKKCIQHVVGLGGIGKTTLAQHLYNDEEVKKHFELKAWVSVLMSFMSITLMMYGTKVIVSGYYSKALLISKVLMTTLDTEVAKVMDPVQMYTLKLFSNKDALSLFSQHASGDQNFDVSRILKLHGEDIVKKCGSLPLALRKFGRAFRTKSTYEECEALE
ncbi:hypothetical protein QVD17_39028 [Tagetes erecta]|uniref:NB-ARC domain-containing protein n=1 Tax=Tagetes erecta TaxID=13708 RepID=A0AAD8JRK6_TARER|nr:hypothetical protein QVD17_39028 [Tagetes erecta]